MAASWNGHLWNMAGVDRAGHAADAQVLAGKAAPRGRYPHFRRAGDYVYVSGTSARRPDNTFAGASADAMGTVWLDIRAQTRAVCRLKGRNSVSPVFPECTFVQNT